MKLEVEMYAYSKKCRDYGIGIIVNITENGLGFKGDLIDIQYKHSKHAIEIQDIEASYDIIDLIEVGDYVNGFRVEYVYNPTGNKVLWIKLSCNPIDNYENKDIKSIITKEQFEQMSYKVGEKDNNNK